MAHRLYRAVWVIEWIPAVRNHDAFPEFELPDVEPLGRWP